MQFKRQISSAAMFLYTYMVLGLFRTLPLRWGFALLVVATRLRFRGTGLACRVYRVVASRQTAERPAYFSDKLAERYPGATAEILLRIGAFREGVEVLSRSGAMLRLPGASLIMARLLFELAEFDDAYAAVALWQSPADLVYLKGLLELVVGDENRAVWSLVSAAGDSPSLQRPHQNMSARVPSAFVPNELDAAAGALGHLYDAYNFVGQRVTHVGAGHLSTRLYCGALRAQRELRKAWPELSADLRSTLSMLGISLNDLRLLPAEWVSQIGHLALMDSHLRMRDLGWWRGRALVLAPSSGVANGAMLSLFDSRCHIFASSQTSGSALFNELTSLQRYCGMSFNAFELPTGELVPWSEAGALMMRQWETEGRGCPLVPEYDRRIGLSDRVLARMDDARRNWGMGPQDWYVCLHVRDASHYGEMPGAGQSHRNAEIAAYVPMIKHITARGGWVIKLGGPMSPKFPTMERFIDYACSPLKSEIMDLHLIRHAHYYVGTTSGLANVAISFGVPSALVNCITVDAQLWSDRVRFALKPVKNREGRMLRQRQITSTPWRWRLFAAEVMQRHGLVAQENSPDEILETVKEVEEVANVVAGADPAFPVPPADVDALIESWRRCLDLPHFYGNARPSRYYIRKYESEFLRD
jgi:putative glycosyltransferase (TIGR04372 family)